MSAPTMPTAGRVGHLTQLQQEALDLLRKELVQENCFAVKRHDDSTLLRFLRARRFDVQQACQMVANQEAWRQEYKVDELVQSFDFKEEAAVRKLYAQYYHKTDKLGRPLYIEHLCNLNVKELYNITTLDRILQKLVVEYERSIQERFVACTLAAGTHIEQSCTILDLQGVSMLAFPQVISFIKQITKIGQDYYPEQLGIMFIINAPMLFSGAWSVVKPFLDEVTVKKISILGSSYKSKILEYVDAENLPARLGGTCKCPTSCTGAPAEDPKLGACDVSNVGPWATVSKQDLEAYHAKLEAKNQEKLESVKLDLEAHPLAPTPRRSTTFKRSMEAGRNSIDKRPSVVDKAAATAQVGGTKDSVKT